MWLWSCNAISSGGAFVEEENSSSSSLTGDNPANSTSNAKSSYSSGIGNSSSSVQKASSGAQSSSSFTQLEFPLIPIIPEDGNWCGNKGECGIIIDERDDNVYRWINIKGQIWLADNLRYLPDTYQVNTGHYKSAMLSSNKRDEIISSEYYPTLGIVYAWEQAIEACPEGWHLPDYDEWSTLLENTGGTEFAQHKLKTSTYWEPGYAGSDDFEFAALPLNRDKYWAAWHVFYKGVHEIDGANKIATQAFMIHKHKVYFRINQLSATNSLYNMLNVRCIKGDNLPQISTLHYPSPEFVVGDTFSLEVTVLPVAAVNKNYSCTSQNPTIASVDPNCKVTALSPGNATLTTITAAGELKDTLNIKVHPQPQLEGFFIDPRDGNEYPYTKIGDQIWMSQNLRYIPDPLNSIAQNPTIKGVLYTLEEARNACPDGWHLPDTSEFKVLFNNIGPEYRALKLKAREGWLLAKDSTKINFKHSIYDRGGIDAFNFSALPTQDGVASWWLYEKGAKLNSETYFYLSRSHGDVLWTERAQKKHNVRCVKGLVLSKNIEIKEKNISLGQGESFKFNVNFTPENTSNKDLLWLSSNPSIAEVDDKGKVSALQVGTTTITATTADVGVVSSTTVVVQNSFIDARDGHLYTYSKFGNLEWMTKDLKYLPALHLSSKKSESIPYYYIYGNPTAALEDAPYTIKYQIYGVLYNWAAADQACPEGWRLPTETDFDQLISVNGGLSAAPLALKASYNWPDKSLGDNTSGFSAIGVGKLDDKFTGIDSVAYWWGAEVSATKANSMFLNSSGILPRDQNKTMGQAVRCVRESL